MQVKFRDGSQPQSMSFDVGSRLDAIRKASGMTQGTMCEALNVSRTSYQNYVRNERDMPMSLVKIVIEQFDLDADWFLFGDEGRDNKGAKE